MEADTKQQLDFEAAHRRLKDVVKHTPLEYNAGLSEKYECEVYLKREDLQVVRSYKLRGAYNMIGQLSAQQLESPTFGPISQKLGSSNIDQRWYCILGDSNSQPAEDRRRTPAVCAQPVPTGTARSDCGVQRCPRACCLYRQRTRLSQCGSVTPLGGGRSDWVRRDRLVRPRNISRARSGMTAGGYRQVKSRHGSIWR